MRMFRSMATIFAFGGMGLYVLTAGPFRTDGRYAAFFDWIDGLVADYGREWVGMGLIGFGFVFAGIWSVVGHNR